MTRRLAIFGVCLAAAAVLATLRPARAATATATLTVQATVLGSCTIGNANLNFGNYDPNLATNHDVTGNVAIQCTYNSQPWLGLGDGANHAATRRMSGGTGEYLNYELYIDAARTTVWSTTNGPVVPANTAGAGLAPYSIPVYGRVPPGQIVSTGLFQDTVTMTLNF